MLSDLRFGLRLSAHSISERPSNASSVADRDGRQQPLLESVCDNGLVQDIHMASLIQYVESGHVQLKYELPCTLSQPHVTKLIHTVDRVEGVNELFIQV